MTKKKKRKVLTNKEVLMMTGVTFHYNLNNS